MKRTPTIQVDEDFQVGAPVTKSWTAGDGRRWIRGVASGVATDRQGERCSARCIARMAATPVKGMKLTASAHSEEWLNDIGKVESLTHDRETDELLCEASLPPEGEDAIADKAWKRLAGGERLGFSIGGKLKGAFFELVEKANGTAVRQKVLDDVALRHMTLTSQPAYAPSFVETVAKTFTGAATDQDFTIDEAAEQELVDAEAIAKAARPANDESAQDTPDDDTPAKDEPAAATGEAQPAGDSDEADDQADLPEGKGERHLSCPNCGHEFAAPLPTDAPLGANDTTTDKGEARKSTTENDMDLNKTLEGIRALADAPAAGDVEKTEAAEPTLEARADDVVAVEKTDEELSDVEKLVAASHRSHETAIADLVAKTGEGFEALTEVVKSLAERVAAMPQGRRSQAVVLPAPGEVEKTAIGTDDVAKAIEQAETPLDALKAINAANGVR